jgi:hypothetical protein
MGLPRRLGSINFLTEQYLSSRISHLGPITSIDSVLLQDTMFD